MFSDSLVQHRWIRVGTVEDTMQQAIAANVLGQATASTGEGDFLMKLIVQRHPPCDGIGSFFGFAKLVKIPLQSFDSRASMRVAARPAASDSKIRRIS